MANATVQPRSRADDALDPSVVSDYAFFTGPNRSKKHRAAIYLAEGDLSERQVAKAVRIARSTVQEWRRHPDFAAVQGHYEGEIIAEALKLPIARKHERVKVLNDLHDKALQVIAMRAARYRADLDDAGDAVHATRRLFGHTTPDEAATGLMARQETANTTGMVTVNWSFDRALVSEIRDLEKQAAQELGQWEETLNVNHGGTIQQEYVIVDDVPWADLDADDAP